MCDVRRDVGATDDSWNQYWRGVIDVEVEYRPTELTLFVKLSLSCGCCDQRSVTTDMQGITASQVIADHGLCPARFI